METRTNSSINIDEPVAITLLARADGNCSGRFAGWSEGGLNLKVDKGLKVGSVVKLEVGEDLMVAEVNDCVKDGKEFSAGLELLQWIGKSELQQLLREVASGPNPRLVPAEAAA